MRALALMASLLAGIGCTRPCRDGTLLLSLTFDAASQAADNIQVEVTVNGATLAGTTARRPAKGTLEVNFAGGYPAGATVTVVVNAVSTTAGVIGTGSASTTLSAKCATLTVVVAGNGSTGEDMSMATPSDMVEPNDLVSAPDLATCIPSSQAQTVYVDPTFGHNDSSHGAAPGGCAYATITYALAHSTGRVNLLNTATYSSGETFPLLLSGVQILDCDPGNTGTKAKLLGLGAFSGTNATVVINGSANQILKCDIATPGTTDDCVYVASSGAHTIDSCNLHACSDGIEGNETTPINGLIVTTDSISADNCMNAIGTNATVKHLTGVCGNDGINNCGAGLTGCGNSITGFASAQCNSCACPSTFFSSTNCP